MRAKLVSVLVDDQAKALTFYTTILGFVKKSDMAVGEYRWLTVVSPDDPEGTQVVLEPDANPASKAFKRALKEQSIPFTSFEVDDIGRETERLKSKGVRFTQEPTPAGPITQAVLDDTCGNLIHIYQMTGPAQ